jgi:alpha-1,6-mannosyltransferase
MTANQPPIRALLLWVQILALAVTLSVLSFALYAHASGGYSITSWLAVSGFSGAAVMYAHHRCSADISHASNESLLWIVLGWAAAMRIAAAFTPALFEDDFYRYLWDGYRTLVDGNPYQAAPSEHFGKAQTEEKLDEILSRVNYPHVNTIYGPALQHLFALSAWIDVGALWPWKLVVCAVDITLIFTLARTFGPVGAMLYAFSPLAIHETAVTAHPDGLIGALIFFAWRASHGRSGWYVAFFMGTAIAMKIHAVIALPFLLLALQLRSGKTLLVAIATGAVYALHWLPYYEGFLNAWQSFYTFARDWQFNAIGFAAINAVVPADARSVAFALFIASVIFCIRWQSYDPSSRSAPTIVLAFAALLLFSPIVNPWYLLWLLPVACGLRWTTPWVAAMAVLTSYASSFNLGAATHYDGRLPSWVTAIECLAIGGAIIWDVTRSLRMGQIRTSVANCG